MVSLRLVMQGWLFWAAFSRPDRDHADAIPWRRRSYRRSLGHRWRLFTRLADPGPERLDALGATQHCVQCCPRQALTVLDPKVTTFKIYGTHTFLDLFAQVAGLWAVQVLGYSDLVEYERRNALQ